MEDERSSKFLFSFPKVDLYLPRAPLTDEQIFSFDFAAHPGRDWVIQGIPLLLAQVGADLAKVVEPRPCDPLPLHSFAPFLLLFETLQEKTFIFISIFS